MLTLVARSVEFCHPCLVYSNTRCYALRSPVDIDDTRIHQTHQRLDEIHFQQIWRRSFNGQLVFRTIISVVNSRDDPAMFDRVAPKITRAKKVMGSPRNLSPRPPS